MRPHVILDEKALQRFWAKVEKTEECWNWTAAKIKGYGVLRVNKINYYAHRLSWELVNGPILGGHGALHKCDNPACVRPDHLFLGTQAENIKDMDSKGRRKTASGLASGKCKLHPDQVAEIRAIGKQMSLRQIARHFGIERSYASRIRNNIRRAE